MAKIVGTSGNNTLHGGAARDSIYGLGGLDRLFGGGNDDLLAGGSGNDVLMGEAGNDSLHGDTGADKLDGGLGNDWALYLDGATGGVRVFLYQHRGLGGAAQGDTLFNIENVQGSKFADALHGDAKDNALFGNGGNDMLYGREGSDTLSGGDGADRLDGGAGSDWATYKDGAKRAVVVSLFNNANGLGAAGDRLYGIENVQGTQFADTIFGSAGGNKLYGEAGSDKLYGREGSDELTGGAGGDRLDGGDDFDWVLYGDEKAGVIVSLFDNANGGAAAGDTIFNVEGVLGTKFGDVIHGTSVANYLMGGGGNDSLFGREGDDTLDGGTGSDSIDGGDGVDWVVFRSANARIIVDLADSGQNGGFATGDLLIDVENVEGTDFNDIIWGNAFSNTLSGGKGDDELHGREGSDVLFGGAGNDKLFDEDVASASDLDIFLPGSGADEVTGDGNDSVEYSDLSVGVVVDLSVTGANQTGGGADGDVLVGILSITGSNLGDTLTSSVTGHGADIATLRGLGGNDTITLNHNNDRGYGGDGSDTLILKATGQLADGGDGSDTLDASAATNATLYGGSGLDTLTGNAAQRDFFVLELNKGADTITNFVSGGLTGDRLAFDNAVYTGIGAALDAGELAILNGGTIQGTAANAQFLFDTVSRGVYYDADGSGAGAAVLLATLNVAVTTLSVGDFQIF